VKWLFFPSGVIFLTINNYYKIYTIFLKTQKKYFIPSATKGMADMKGQQFSVKNKSILLLLCFYNNYLDGFSVSLF